MALLINKNEGVIKVISSKDSSVNCDNKAYEKYLDDLDESILELVGVPTRFVLKKTLNYKEQQLVKDAQVKVEGKSVKVAISYMMEEIRIALIDIENPDDLQAEKKLEYKKGSDGKADPNLVSFLESCGIVTELYSARQNAMGTLTENIKKKSKLSSG